MVKAKMDELSHQQMVDYSWQRCRDAGLDHYSSPKIEISNKGDFTALLDKHQALLETTQLKVLPYYENLLANSNCLVMLADNSGQVINTWGEQRFYQEKHSQMFANGVCWREGLVGTNAIGTALETGSIVQIHHDEHFLQANRFMTGSAAPIFDADRRMLGVIDISGDTYMPQAHTLGLVKVMSQAVENQLIISRFHTEHFLIWFNTSPENIDSQWSALLAFNEQGIIISANRRAEMVLGVELALQNISQVFDIKLNNLLSHPAQTPLPLLSRQNFRFHGTVLPPQQPQGRQLDFRNKVKPVVADSKEELTLSRLNMGDPRVAKAINQVSRIINKDIPILIHGETGVGKEVFVKALHQASERTGGKLVAVNCAAIPIELVESELFGYEKGAFTGANSKGYIGLIRKADKGTLFLDEIGDMPLNIQARLLRVLQERKVTPLGSTESYPVDFKLISATNCNLKTDVESGSFRQDLFYRITGLNITLPPLRERSDKEALIQYLLGYHAEPGRRGLISMEALAAFKSHPWPGNIRQMVSVIHIGLAMAEGNPIELEHLPDDFFDDLQQQQEQRQQLLQAVYTDFSEHTLVMETKPAAAAEPPKQDWLFTFNSLDCNISKTAKVLGISRNTLYKRLRDQGLR